MQQLLWIETLLKFIPGLLLVIAPLTTLRVLGLPRPDAGFWPRLCGALLLGLAGATFIEGTSKGHGLGLAGVIVVNLTGAAVLASLLILEAGPKSRRGTIAVWLTVCALVLLSITEIATL
ncbi:ABC transporter permease [Hyphomicrobium sulfonivorans]|uniref:ABC transporter permease n=1 Tax=Hyphomicrobium sulfonivorans TaxID=121290 RepID=UPI00156EEB02|nr:ABC transporter permease [Hyphomicrobium sulfonivorans]MBI1650691.1 ABC transporter permease [Hyphomicrobium sulfonivorans]NSL71952.1 ABC transporter permease [Hyphomicrobium sulfonivorans]